MAVTQLDSVDQYERQRVQAQLPNAGAVLVEAQLRVLGQLAQPEAHVVPEPDGVSATASSAQPGDLASHVREEGGVAVDPGAAVGAQ
jgi:hypothetical protein